MKKMNTAIWRNGKIIGQCYMASKIREILNTNQSSFYFDHFPATKTVGFKEFVELVYELITDPVENINYSFCEDLGIGDKEDSSWYFLVKATSIKGSSILLGGNGEKIILFDVEVIKKDNVDISKTLMEFFSSQLLWDGDRFEYGKIKVKLN